ncbi:MAG TPA: primosomal protein N' [Rudaea sp.]|jgi:primosomal protein N' (replication factor Y)|nr:primosomal protein N' [Rudaea sp.]
MPRVLRVAVPVPLPQLFDYLPPRGMSAADIAPGSRLAVPFGRGRRVGIVIDNAAEAEIDVARLKPAAALLDPEPIVDAELLATLQWVSRYYLHPLGEVVDTALPVGLRRIREQPELGDLALERVANADAKLRAGSMSARLFDLLAAGPRTYAELDTSLAGWRAGAANLRKRGLVASSRVQTRGLPSVRIDPPPLTTEQRQAVDSIAATFGRYEPFLLDGITGSGKTEVYLDLTEQVLRTSGQVLVLVPEIGLTPALERRFRERVGERIHVLHSNLSDGDRTRAWLAAARGESCVILGTRSAIFVPLPKAGLIVVDEEHDASYKQQDGLRYSARDLAQVRGKALNVPVVLGTATPSLESLANVENGRYQRLHLGSRPGAARLPDFQFIDLRGKRLTDGLSEELVKAVRDCVARGEQALLFRNRRGYSPVLMCHACGWHAACERCDKPMTWHRGAAQMRCHHCGAQRPVPSHCPDCGNATLEPRGVGTERMEQALAKLFPNVPVIRIDRETTRHRGGVDERLQQLRPDQAGILIGTQMLAKGHDLPNLTLVGLIGVDDGLFSVDFRASERLCQLIVQVAGRAGRALKPGKVWLQTLHPDHPLLRGLLKFGYAKVAKDLLEERREASFPPLAFLALLRSEAKTSVAAEAFLTQAAQLAGAPEGISIIGPMSAPMPRRAGFYRSHLLLSAEDRPRLHAFLSEWIARVRALDEARKVRWSLDVDPMDLY